MTDAHLISRFDALLSDLDGVVYAGPHAIPGAVESLQRLDGIGVGLGYVTNNASRTPAQVAAHLRELGAPAEDHQVVSSSQAAAELLASLLPAGAAVLITGSPALAHEIELVGLKPVHSAAEHPVAVVQGFNPGDRLERPGRGIVRRGRRRLVGRHQHGHVHPAGPRDGTGQRHPRGGS